MSIALVCHAVFSHRRGVKTALALPLWLLITAQAWGQSGDTAPFEAAPFEALETDMTLEDQRAAGLDQLNPAQLEFLNQWLRARFKSVPTDDVLVAGSVAPSTEVVGTASKPAAASAAAGPSAVGSSAIASETEIQAEVERRVAAEVQAMRSEIEAAEEAVRNHKPFDAELQPGFDGWNGSTLFRLDNGQVWRQRTRGRYRHQGTDLRVRFDKNFMGFWEMTVLSSDKTVGVTQVR